MKPLHAWRRRLLAAGLVLVATGVHALELNTASQAELESVKGIGTQLSQLLIDARAQRPFADWADVRSRVPGVGVASAKRLSAAGLTVAGRPYGTDATAGADAAAASAAGAAAPASR